MPTPGGPDMVSQRISGFLSVVQAPVVSASRPTREVGWDGILLLEEPAVRAGTGVRSLGTAYIARDMGISDHFVL